MALQKVFVLVAIYVLYAGQGSEAAECCRAYTDFYGDYHESMLCADYCCLQPSLSKLLRCCDDIAWRAPSNQRDQESCLKSWVAEHVWVPIVGGILFVVIIVVCTCCCCCGCCTCCRKKAPTVIVQSGGVPQSNFTTVNQTTQPQMTNPSHIGYDQ